MMPADPDPRTTRPYPASRHLLFWSIALGGAGFDLATKAYFFRWIGEPRAREPITVIRNVLELQTSYNPGALWGFMRDVPHSSLIFAMLSIAAAAGIFVWLFLLGAAVDRRLTVALGLIMAGALGNCYDRLTLRQVRDFVHLHVDAIGFDCAIFNFADNMLVVGALVLVLLALRPEPQAGVEAASVEPAASA
jgi:signal peptidase II